MNITIAVADKILSTTEWPGFLPSVAEYKFPILFRIADGASKLYINRSSGFWVGQPDTLILLNTFPAQKSEPAPNAGISELTLLRAIALVNDPALIKDMK